MSEPTLKQHLAAVRRSLAEVLGEKGCIVEIAPTPLNTKILTGDTPTFGLPTEGLVSVNMSQCKPLRVVPLNFCASTEKPHTTHEKPTMAKLRCRRFMDGDTEMVEIVGITGVSPRGQLPHEYTRQTPHFVRFVDTYGPSVAIYPTTGRNIYIREGDKITYKRYGELLRIMKEAGQRLTDINARRKKEQEFSGEFEVTI